ncbi:YhdP family protein [Caldimonas sp. KR1-144]|uniref:YhdP family phospholipid transporter n=1 Tax=Caldimonas sp. KR1-144 TaxID=3400911 RepID=UPI003C09025F
MSSISPTPVSAALPPAWRPSLLAASRVALRWLLGACAFAAILIGGAWLILQWGILPRIDDWRAPLEARASAAIGRPVRIGVVSASGHGGWSQAIDLSDVRVQAADGSDALVLARVRAVVSPASLLHWPPRFDALQVDGVALDVRRRADGHLVVAGIDLGGTDGGASDDSAAADWLFSQPSLALAGGTLVWTDEARGAAPITLTGVDIALRNGVRSHALRIDATPPEAWGARFSLRGRFTQPLLGSFSELGEHGAAVLARPSDWRRWRGMLYAEFPQADIERLRSLLDVPGALASGRGALRGWFDWRAGRIGGLTLDVALADASAQLAPELQPLAVSQLSGRLSMRFEPQAGEVALERLAFTTDDGLAWPAGDLRLAWRERPAGPTGPTGAASAPPWAQLAGGQLQAQRLDLALLARIAERLPLPPDWRERLAELAPGGVVQGLDWRWDGRLDAPERYRVSGSVQQLSLAAAGEVAAAAASAAASAAGLDAALPPEPAASHASHQAARPGLSGADIAFSATEAGGEARVVLGAAGAGSLSFPGVFEQPRLAFTRLSGQVAWTLSSDRQEVRVRGLAFANDDTEGSADATWSRVPGAPAAGVLELGGRLLRARAASVPRYLPTGVPADVRHYLERAIRGGQVGATSFRLKGPLHEFPFAQPASDNKPGAKPAAARGEFRVVAKLEDVNFAYLPGDAGQAAWPAFARVRGELIFDRGSMELRNLQAALAEVGSGQVQLARVRGVIADLSHQPLLAIEGQAAGPLADLLRFVNVSPVGGWLHGALADASATGNADLKLALQIPLSDGHASTVRGELVLGGNDVRLRPDVPLLANAKARIGFSERDFSLNAGSARALGGDVAFDGARAPDGAYRFNLQGTLSAEGLRRASELGPWSRLAGQLGGQTSYRGTLGFVQGWPEWQFSSNLVGLSSELPAPLRKAAADTLPLRVGASLQQDGLSAAAARDVLRLDLGTSAAPVAQAEIQRDWRADGAQVRAAAIGIGEAPPAAVPGGAARINLAMLDLDAWQRVGDLLQGGGGAAAPGAPAGAGDGYLPASIALRAQSLLLNGRRLNRVVAGLSRGTGADAGLWRANVDAAELNGYVEWRGAGAGAVRARLARLALPASETEAVAQLLDQAPASVPALDIVIDDFELRGKRLGKLEVDAVNRADAGGEWRLNKLAVTTPEAQFSATGRWAPAANAAQKRRTELDFKLDVGDSGALLARLGQGQALRGGKGRLSGKLNWLGAPFSIDYKSLGGELAISLESGQFLQAEPGVARLLGVLSLQSLPRRLLLDFRDVFNEGFAFDAITGDALIERGVASTRNLRMRGVQAVVLMEGMADLERETQDLRVWIVPEINAGAASLAYAVINPAIGLGSFIAQWMLRRPLTEAGTREFHVTGTWADPKVDKIEKPGAVAGAASAPRSPPP